MNELEKRLKEVAEETDFSGVLLIVKDDMDLYLARGYSDKVNKLKNDGSTSFGIASGTKLFTALGIMKLIENEQLTLETRVFDILNKPFDGYDSSVTIKQLLSHTSGLPDYFDEDEITDFENFEVSIPWYKLTKPSDYLQVLPNKPMKFSPGELFKYNNSGFILLAMVIEKITGDYYHYIETKILNKVRMQFSGFYAFNQLPVNTAYGYVKTENGYRTNIYDLPLRGGGDGGMYTCVDNMQNFWEALHRGEIISLDLYYEMLKPIHKSDGLSYGLGVWLKKVNDVYYPLIIGQDSGVSFESGVMEDGAIYTVCSNTEHGVWPLSKIINK